MNKLDINTGSVTGSNGAVNAVNAVNDHPVFYNRVIDRYGVVHVMEDRTAYKNYLEKRERIGY